MPYHHGNLRESLIETATELAAADGPDDISLREVARRVGVSHNAAYRHFADRDELLRAVAARAMTRFGELMARRIADAPGSPSVPALDGAERTGAALDPAVEAAYARFEATGRAYVEFAAEHSGLFRTAMSFPLGSVAPDSAVEHPYAQLSRQLDELVATGAVTAERRANAEIAAWSAVHGFAVLWQAGLAPDETRAAREHGLLEVLRVVRYGI